jgi:hypothetical protein
VLAASIIRAMSESSGKRVKRTENLMGLLVKLASDLVQVFI